MDIASYLTEIEYAASILIETIWKERLLIEELENKISQLSAAVERNYRQAEDLQYNAETSDDLMLGVGRYWDNYFGEDKERYYKDKERQDLANQIASHSFSVSSLSGDLLQHAKQGISFSHGKLTHCPDGRLIGSQPLKTIIWQGRNQSLHWEDGKFHGPTSECFEKLADEIDPLFWEYKEQNMAFRIVSLLGWTNFAKFRNDMILLK